jgi:hypothetical protein
LKVSAFTKKNLNSRGGSPGKPGLPVFLENMTELMKKTTKKGRKTGAKADSAPKQGVRSVAGA